MLAVGSALACVNAMSVQGWAWALEAPERHRIHRADAPLALAHAEAGEAVTGRTEPFPAVPLTASESREGKAFPCPAPTAPV